MNKLITSCLAAAIAASGISTAALAADKTTDEIVKEQRAAEDVLVQARQVFTSVATSPQGKLPESVARNAKCVAVFPNVITAAIVAGGSHGDGVISCRHDGKWSAPAFVDLTGASLGVQLGGKSTDVTLFLTTEEAVSALRRGKFAINADASVAMGSYDKSFDTAKKGVIVYQRSNGAYVGASVAAGNISRDEEATRAYYGHNVNDLALIDGTTSPRMSETAQSFVSILPAG